MTTTMASVTTTLRQRLSPTIKDKFYFRGGLVFKGSSTRRNRAALPLIPLLACICLGVTLFVTLVSCWHLPASSIQDGHDPTTLSGKGFLGRRSASTIAHTRPPISLHRVQYEKDHNLNLESIQHRVQKFGSIRPIRLPADLYRCPETPPSHPKTWPLLEILRKWPVDDVNIPESLPSHVFHSLCILDWDTHSQEQIDAYQRAEVPFVLRNHPVLLKAAERWNAEVPLDNHGQSPVNVNTTTRDTATEPYFVKLLRSYGSQKTKLARKSNKLSGLSFSRRPANFEAPKDWVAPTEELKMDVAEWWEKAQQLDHALEEGKANMTESDHYYWTFTATDAADRHAFLYDEVPIFRPDVGSNMFMYEPDKHRGIRCRFGMTGTVAEGHFDTFRNWVVMLKGKRRIILAPPEQCPNMDLHPLGHVRGRHSANPLSELPETLRNAQALQVILRPSDALYIPTAWFHFLVSLSTTIQCNAPSGTTLVPNSREHAILQTCGFDILG